MKARIFALRRSARVALGVLLLATLAHAAPEESAESGDMDVLPAEQWERERDAERLRSLEIDDQLDLCCLLDWHVSGLFALENSAGVYADLM